MRSDQTSRRRETYGPVDNGVQEIFNADGKRIGKRAVQWVPTRDGKGRTRTKWYDADTPDKVLRDWCDAELVAARQQKNDAPQQEKPRGLHFLARIEKYLELRETMPTIKERTRHMRLWAALFGDCPVEDIASDAGVLEIRAQRERWLTRGPKWVYVNGERELKPIPISPQEVNLRMRALENFFTVMYPKLDNPVRAVPECAGAVTKPRGQSFALAEEILRHWPDVTTPKPGELAEEGSLSRIRFEVELHTGLEHKQIARLQRTDINWNPEHPSYLPPRRLKGTSPGKRERPKKEPKRQPLLPAALPKLEQFFALGANKKFSRASVWRSLHAAIRAANRERERLGIEERIDEKLSLKDLTRHTFATEMLRISGKLHVVKELVGHSTLAQTEVYTEKALNEDAIAAVTALNDFITQPPQPRPRRPQRGTSKVRKVTSKVSPQKVCSSVKTGKTTIRRITQ